MRFTMPEIKVPEIKVTVPEVNIPKVEMPDLSDRGKLPAEDRENIAKTLNTADRVGMKAKLLNYKNLTLLGKKLPKELRSEVTAHVTEMNKRGWLSGEDMRWCDEQMISY